ncbi:MAG: chloride channel protein [Pararhizobium sp.]
MKMLRRSRALMVSPRLWKPRLVFWIGALAVGITGAGFAATCNEAQVFFGHLIEGEGWRRFLPLIVTPVGFVFCAYLADRFFLGSQGSGIPQCIAARHLRDDEHALSYLSLKTILGKIVLTVVGLATGASIGREGPTVQIGASLVLQSGRLGGMGQARGLILAGSAAGLAAAFNTPLAGVVFAIEEMGRSYQARTNGVVLVAVIIAGLASIAIAGNYTYFGVTKAVASFPGDWPLVIACGTVGGVFGAAFSESTLRLTKIIRRWRSVQPRYRVLVVAAAAGLLVAILGISTHGLIFGTGYGQARSAIEGAHLPASFFIAKLVANLASTVSGIPGGIFAPALAVGAGLGSALGPLFGANASLAAVLGMAGYFAGVVQSPMTAFVIIVEMTGNQGNIVPLMAASVLGYGTARLITPEPLYHALSRFSIADALRRRRQS